MRTLVQTGSNGMVYTQVLTEPISREWLLIELGS
jgi:hypothetical protein